MIQNLKVDVIYHQTPSDFEMEFNLCGCCRMRLLSDKTTDKKTFIKALARDVARSRIIIGCGPLFGNDGLISMVAKAIGASLTACDNKTYGISSDESINIISGSTPLVTADGYFGGCIIESGPQTIILLTENRAFRKSIMQNLIHPYIEEISYTPSKSSLVTSNHTEEVELYPTAVAETENYITQSDAYSDEPLEDIQPTESKLQTDEHNIDFIMDSHETEPEEVNQSADTEPVDNVMFDNMFTEIEHPDEIKSRYEQPYTTSESDSMFLAEPEYDLEDDEKHTKNPTRTMDITIIILVLLLLLAILALVYFIVLRPLTMGIGVGDYIKQIFSASNSTLT